MSPPDLSPPGSARPSRRRSFYGADIKRARNFRDDRRPLKKPAERAHAVDQSNRRFWMQKIERINPNITIVRPFEQPPECPPEECPLLRFIAQPSIDPRNNLLHRNLRVQHVWLRKKDCTSGLQHAVDVAYRRFDFEVMQDRTTHDRIEHTFRIAQRICVLNLILNIWRGAIGPSDFQKLR